MIMEAAVEQRRRDDPKSGENAFREKPAQRRPDPQGDGSPGSERLGRRAVGPSLFIRPWFSWARLLVAALALALGVARVSAAPVTTLAFQTDGTVLVSGEARCLVLRSPDDGHPLQRIPVELPRLMALGYHPPSGRLLVGGGTPGSAGVILVVDSAHARLVGAYPVAEDVVTGLAFDSDGTCLAVTAMDGTARVYQVGTDGVPGAVLFPLSGHSGPVLAVAFSPDGQRIVTAGADRSVKVWSAADGRCERSLGQHTEAVHALAFRPAIPGIAGNGREADPGWCASGSDDRTVRIWQPGTGRMVRIIRGHDGPVLALAYRPDGSALFSAGPEGIVRSLDPDSDTVRAAWRDHADWIQALAVSPDGTRLASGDSAGVVRVRILEPPAGPARESGKGRTR